MAPVMPLTAPPTFDVHNTLLREQALDPNNCAHNNNNNKYNDNNTENDNNNSTRQQQQKELPCQNGEIKQQQQKELPCQNGEIKQQQQKELPCQNGEIKQQQPHSEQEGLSRTAAVAPEQTVLDERDNEDLNSNPISVRPRTRASLDITIANHELNVRRKVSWSDTRGNNLVQVWEFQPSDSSDSDDDGEDDSQACACVIV
ncbi:uncharacterized protein LOC131072141 isoform X1 [Cryptomeria japonica]|uniref:uncharacterized protein LOC131072141 isoform X1 n=1 Tax=Cryptomeria japonica TaxID=3369 RepID=UPI0027DA1FA4|nr:uncharacterized protein LOC131072141 isoform X1 [Cryptomeria japonica]XP_057864206.2 uncharacterized protein LOC131072141 isoform X1 [Cryptomeria japonica]XP_057864213.2 uncharacterized protein LOC131072141 isoform X1 [Cryptomeria japonica]